MHLIILNFVGPLGSRPEPEALRDQIAAFAEVADRIEHLWVSTSPDGVDLGVFLLAPDQGTALRTVRRVCARALGSRPLPDGWQVSASWAANRSRP